MMFYVFGVVFYSVVYCIVYDKQSDTRSLKPNLPTLSIESRNLNLIVLLFIL